jgi:hypothetical protein
MWLPQLLKILNEKEMKALGMKISAEDIYSINKGSLKDAIVHFGGFCTSELISDKGLLLTNHHCGYDAIQSHSSLQDNILKNGFWAKTLDQEKPNPGLSATFIERIDDVTIDVMAGVSASMSVADRSAVIKQNVARVKESYKLLAFQDVIIKPFFDGNQYFAFLTITYPDVRLVGTPPESIGKFGSDTDNWVWPRHTGDFSLFRIYAGKDNLPAEYSKDNVPFKPKHFLPISMDGVEDGDFTMVFGFPGRTSEYLPAAAVDQLVEHVNPVRIAIRDKSLKIMDKYMRADPSIKIKYASKYASIANYWKKWIGESQGLKQTHALKKKLDYEHSFTKRLDVNSPYVRLLPELGSLYQNLNPLAVAREAYIEVTQRNVDLTSWMFSLKSLVSAYENNGETGYKKALDKIKASASEFYKDFDPTIDSEKLGNLLDILVSSTQDKYVPSFLKKENLGMSLTDSYTPMIQDQYKLTSFSDLDGLNRILALVPEKAVKAIKEDGFYAWMMEWNIFFNKEINDPYLKIKGDIDLKQELYTKAQMEIMTERKFYPDANSTLRVTYGQVNGYQPKDGVRYKSVTYLDGVVEKYIPGDYEFDLPQRFLDLHKARDYGRYADHTGNLPVCFIGTNHTTGGNSGSPAIDAYGNLIGLNFDRVWEGTMSDINYDASICRNIMVDARFILWTIDKFAQATHLIDEMKLVHPKGKKKKIRKGKDCNC